MTERVSPLVRSRRLATALRRLRTASGRTVEEVAVHLECSAAKVSRMENGLVTVRIQDARDLLDFYRVEGAEREQLIELVRQARGRAWWYPYTDLMADGFDRYMGFEEEAAAIWTMEARVVPGLLQTEGYMTALSSSLRDTSAESLERKVRFRLQRQQILVRPDPPQMHLLLDEAALRRRIGSPALMADQHRQLINAAQTGNVKLRVIPLDAEPHQAPGFSFTVFGFADPADPKVVFEELLEGTVFFETAEKAGRYMAAFEQAQAVAWTEEASLRFLTELAAQGEGG